MAVYYNEFKPEAAHMLRHLINDGLIAAGDVDERSITEVSADDLRGYTQCHFFAGIGGWSVALRLAGWDDARPVWTGSCPCQPFSSAGRQKGKADERHLWPVWFRLIRESRPSIVFGEQVASAIAHGWWDDVATDMESQGYACGAAVLPACSVGKPHKRDRLWFVGNSEHHGWDRGQITGSDGSPIRDNAQGAYCSREPEGAGEPGYVANAKSRNRRYECKDQRSFSSEIDTPTNSGWAGSGGCMPKKRVGETVDVADSECWGRPGSGALGEPEYPAEGGTGQADKSFDDSAGVEWIACPDGKQRPVEPGICLLAHGVQHRAPILHAFGNAIVPQVAAAFIEATKRV